MGKSARDKTPNGPPPTMGRRQRKALAVRRALLDAGLALFDRQPIALVSVLDITEAADVAKGVFYLHFSSKDDFLLALCSDVDDALLERIGTATVGARSVTARVQRIATAYRAFALESSHAARFRVRMSAYFADEVGQPRQLVDLHESFIQQLAAILGSAGAARPSAAARRRARLVDACCRGMIAESCRSRTDPPDEASFTRIIAAVWRTLTA